MSRTARNRKVSISIAVTGSLLLAACGGVGADDSSDDSGSAGKPEGTIDTMGFSLQDVIASSRVDTFEKDFSDVTVDVAEGGFDEQQFLSAVSSGNPPSLIYLDRTELGTYAARGALTPLDDCITEQDVDMDQYRDSAVSQVTYDDQIYGIPEFANVRIVMINQAALTSAKLTPADIDTSDWDALKEISADLTETSGGKLGSASTPRSPNSSPCG